MTSVRAVGSVTVGGVEYGVSERSEKVDLGIDMMTGGYCGRLVTTRTYRDACGPAWDALLASVPQVGTAECEAWAARVQSVLDAVKASS